VKKTKMANAADAIAILCIIAAAVFIIVGIVLIAWPLIDTGAVDRETGILAFGFVVGGIVIAILCYLFVKPGVVINRT
jgi:hypothetical protein